MRDHPAAAVMVPVWLHVLAIVSLAVAVVATAWVAVDIARRPQRMWIMNVVWPVTALYSSVIGLAFYLAYGRAPARTAAGGEKQAVGGKAPYPISVAKAAIHCGAGCTLGDLIAETLAVVFPGIAVWLGWRTLFGEKMFAVWILDFIVAFALGIVFQYFTIAPMRKLGFRDGVVAALKADTLSLAAWQVGMYGVMALAQFALFRPIFGVRPEAASVEFWFVMQVAMLAGFLTSYPVNWLLLRFGLKEEM